MASDEAAMARREAAAAREDAEHQLRREESIRWPEALKVYRRIKDHSRAETFTAMVQRELTRRGEEPS